MGSGLLLETTARNGGGLSCAQVLSFYTLYLGEHRSLRHGDLLMAAPAEELPILGSQLRRLLSLHRVLVEMVYLTRGHHAAAALAPEQWGPRNLGPPQYLDLDGPAELPPLHRFPKKKSQLDISSLSLFCFPQLILLIVDLTRGLKIAVIFAGDDAELPRNWLPAKRQPINEFHHILSRLFVYQLIPQLLLRRLMVAVWQKGCSV